MGDNQEPQSYIKKKDKPNAVISFRKSSFTRNNSFKPGGMAPGNKFNPSTFKTQHKG